ncbi:phosphoribosyltransferase family protein [Rhodoligotrophos defluvii]|uniref:phosphoribosyltransferase family protein n=1 Tax=Rhodoligotrophos defluvii TaxID=2561934 RepID=UPI0010C9D96A|nr:phosphoribosyltransferase family protein [Rhodoligotrophos defluvii]
MLSAEKMRQYAERTRRILDQSGAILSDDHFVYDSGQHGSGWIDKDVINERPDREDGLCAMLADLIRDLDAEVICGPATGGLIVSQWTAHALGVLSVFAEHSDRPASAPGGPLRAPFVLRRGYDKVVNGKRVVVVDDVVNTGLAMRETVDAVLQCGGTVVAAAAIITRGNARPADCGVTDLRYLLECKIPSWPAANCPLCRAGVPVNVQYAHGADFVARQAQGRR